MNSVLSSMCSLMKTFDGKAQEFISDIDSVHMVWLEEIQQEATRMFSRDFNAEPELMPKTPSQKKNSRRKRVSVGRDDNQARRRFSKGKRSNLRGSAVKSLNLISEEEPIPEARASGASPTTPPTRATRKNQLTQPEVNEDVRYSPHGTCEPEMTQNRKPEVREEIVEEAYTACKVEVEPEDSCSSAPSPPKVFSPEIVVKISAADRLSAELAKKAELSSDCADAKTTTTESSRRSSVRCSLKLRHSLAGLRHSKTQEAIRRASRRSMLKKKAARAGNSTCSSNISEDSCMDSVEEEEDEDKQAVAEAAPADTEEASPGTHATELSVHPSLGRVTRSVAAHSPILAPPPLFSIENKVCTPNKKIAVNEKPQTPQSARRSRRSTKRKAPDTVEESPSKRLSPPKKSQTAIKPHMKSFLHTVQKNQMLMMTPNTLGRSGVIKSFIKHTTPLRIDPKTKERHKIEALKKKQELEVQRMRKMEEEKRKKQEELKRKRDERLRRVIEAKEKEELKEEEKKKKIEQKMAQIDEKNDKRHAEEKAKRKVATKRQEELELKKKVEEEAKRKKIQEEEKRQQELLAIKKSEEEEQKACKLAEARRALELKREQERERERELEREAQAAAEREKVEKEKALTLQRELERAAREKERRDLEEKRKALEEKRKREEDLRKAAEKAAKEREAAEKAARERQAAERAAKEREAAEKAEKEREAAKLRQVAANAQPPAALNVTVDIEHSVVKTPVGKGGGLNVTVDIEKSPQSYVITPKGGNKPLFKSKSLENYGMDQNSDDSTDDESAPKKPIPSWAQGPHLQQLLMKQYFNPPDFDSFFGEVEPPRLEKIFYKSKPRYFKRTSSAVWHSPPNLK